MWYREAQLGILNLDKHLFQGAEQAIINWVKNDVLLDGDLIKDSPELKGKYVWNDNEVPSFLKYIVKGIDHNTTPSRGGIFNTDTRFLSVPKTIDKKTLDIFLNRVLHEIRHAVDPRFNNPKYLEMYTRTQQPVIIYRNILDHLEKTNTVINGYNEYLFSLLLKHHSADELMKDPTKFMKIMESLKKVITESDFNKAKEAFLSGHNLQLDNPVEHPTQLGDVKGLLNKKYLDLVRKKYYPKINDIGWREFLKRTLTNVGSVNFEKLSKYVDEVSFNDGLSFSYIVKNMKDKNWQQKYLSQVAQIINQYESANPLSGLVRKENLVNISNPNAGKNLSSFLSKARQLESMAENNPKTWSRFINFPMVSKMIPKNLSGIFKNLGTGSKSLSESLRGVNFNSPYWQLLEPALEFGLYQFGLYLENPSAYKTPEQRTINYLKAVIDSIKSNKDIKNKRAYFIKNYGSSLKTLGSMERNDLLDNFNTRSFDEWMEIAKNLGVK